MGRPLVRVAGTLVLAVAMAACATEQAEAPTFRVTAPPQLTTTTSEPGRLAWVAKSELTPAERDLCSFIEATDAALSAVDQQNRQDGRTAQEAADDRTISEPIRVRMLRNAELRNARRLAGVLAGFGAGAEIIERIEPTEYLPADALAAIGSDAELIAAIGVELDAAVDRLEPLDPTEQAAYAERTGTEWQDLFTEADLEAFRADLDRSGLGRTEQARQAMDRIDDWSWRHCSEGFSG